MQINYSENVCYELFYRDIELKGNNNVAIRKFIMFKQFKIFDRRASTNSLSPCRKCLKYNLP